MPDHVDDEQAIRQEYDYRIRSASTLIELLWTEGNFSVDPPTERSKKKDPIVSILDKLALCLIRTSRETVAVSLIDDQLQAACDKAIHPLTMNGSHDGLYTENSALPIKANTQRQQEIEAREKKEEKEEARKMEEARLNDLAKQHWIQSAINATSKGEMTDVIHQYYGNHGQPRLKGIDLSAHGEVMFALLRDSLRDAPHGSLLPRRSKEQAYIHEMMLYCYVVGMSLAKLGSSLKDLLEIEHQTTWLRFREFLKIPVKPEDFEDLHEKLDWSQTHRANFDFLLSKNGIVLDAVRKQSFCKTPIKFDEVFAWVFHRLVKALLTNIFYYRENLFTKIGRGVETVLCINSREFCKRLQRLVLNLERLSRFTQLPQALELYVKSIKPPPANRDATSNGATKGKIPDDVKDNRALTNQVRKQLAMIDEQPDDSGNIRLPKVEQISSDPAKGSTCHVKPNEPEEEGCYHASMWRARYQQWIIRIIRQFSAIERLVHLNHRGQLRRIQNMDFIPVQTNPPTQYMEHWTLTVIRVMNEPLDEHERSYATPTLPEPLQTPANQRKHERERMIAALVGLCNNASASEAYSWLDKNTWSKDFRGTVHCEATLACKNLALELSHDTQTPLTSKIGVSRKCCFVCELVLEEVAQYSGVVTSTLFSGRSNRVWSVSLPNDCPLQIVRSVSDKLDQRLRLVLLQSLPRLEIDLKNREAKSESAASLSNFSDSHYSDSKTWKEWEDTNEDGLSE